MDTAWQNHNPADGSVGTETLNTRGKTGGHKAHWNQNIKTDAKGGQISSYDFFTSIDRSYAT